MVYRAQDTVGFLGVIRRTANRVNRILVASLLESHRHQLGICWHYRLREGSSALASWAGVVIEPHLDVEPLMVNLDKDFRGLQLHTQSRLNGVLTPAKVQSLLGFIRPLPA